MIRDTEERGIEEGVKAVLRKGFRTRRNSESQRKKKRRSPAKQVMSLRRGRGEGTGGEVSRKANN